MNKQTMEKQSFRDKHGDLEVHSVFPTIQGEGPFAGRPAIFVRLAGCNLQCTFCDTDYTSKRALCSVETLYNRISAFQPSDEGYKPLVVITGGEPFRQYITPLVWKLISKGYLVQIETNGTLYVPGPWDDPNVTIVCSPKTSKLNQELKSYIHSYKYVVKDGDVDSDGLPFWSLGHSRTGDRVARPHLDFRGNVYVQPMDEHDSDRNHLNLQVAMETCLKHGYTLCLQIHKIIGVE
jgi:7-carboxy-7-deazaguanine synthase